MRKVLVVVLAIICSTYGWVLQQSWLNTACSGNPISTVVLSEGCTSIGGTTFFRYTCLGGSEVIIMTCSDSACAQCVSSTLDMFTGGACFNVNQTQVSVKYTCQSTFPSVQAGDAISNVYFTPNCQGEPLSRTITPIGTDTASCSAQAEAVGCITVAQSTVAISTSVVCGKDVNTAAAGTGAPTPVCTVNTTAASSSCNFYWNCLEASVGCAVTDYALAVGYQSCNEYADAMDSLSPSGQQWLNSVSVCVQSRLAPVATGSKPSCSSIRNTAYQSQLLCVTANYSSCFGPSDWNAAMSTYWNHLLTADGNVRPITASGCFAGYTISYVYLLTNVEGQYNPTAIINKIAQWANASADLVSIVDSTDQSFIWTGHSKRKRADPSANITFTIAATSEQEASNYAVTFNQSFATQTEWPNTTATSCSASSASACAATKTVVTGKEPSSSSSGTTGSGSASGSVSGSPGRTNTASGSTTAVNSSGAVVASLVCVALASALLVL